MTTRKQTKKWTMKNGTKIRICDMADSHLINTINLLRKHGENLRQQNLNFFLNCPPPSGEMALMEFDKEFDFACDATEEDFVPEIYFDMLDEAVRRGIEP